jgi:hypothetical protein
MHGSTLLLHVGFPNDELLHEKHFEHETPRCIRVSVCWLYESMREILEVCLYCSTDDKVLLQLSLIDAPKKVQECNLL